MIYELNRKAAINAISKVIKEQDNDLLQRMYSYFSNKDLVSKTEILTIWNGLTSLDDISEKSLNGIFEFLIMEGKLGEPTDYLIEIDTSPIKKEFLNSIQNNKTRELTAFYLELFTEHIESFFHKDLCKLSEEEAMNGILKLPALNMPTLTAAISIARKYCKWCQDTGKFEGKAHNPFKRIKARNVPLEPWVRENLIKSSLEMYLKINNVLPFDKGYLAPIVVALVWIGFSLEECLSIKTDDVDLYEKKIKDKSIPDEFVPVVSGYYHFVEDMNSCDGVFLRHLSNKLFGTPFKKVDLTNSLSVYEGLNFSNIRLSSQLYKLFLLERAEVPLTKEKCAEVFDYDLSKNFTANRILDKLAMYRAYKNVFWN